VILAPWRSKKNVPGTANPGEVWESCARPWIWKDIGRSVPETRAAGAASIGLWFINVRKPYVNGLVAWCAVRDKLQPPYFMGKSKEIWKIL
jgi:hypothetical protein